MDIPYGALKSSRTGRRDGLHRLEELEEWSLLYEREHMIPAAPNGELGARTLDTALFNVPVRLRGIGKQFVAALLEPWLRSAMM